MDGEIFNESKGMLNKDMEMKNPNDKETTNLNSQVFLQEM